MIAQLPGKYKQKRSRSTHTGTAAPVLRRKFKLLHHACNFSSEVISTLLQAFALLEAGELDDLDLAAQVLSNLSGVLSNRQVAVLDELLIDQAVLLEELLDLALDHLLLDCIRLVGGLRIARNNG